MEASSAEEIKQVDRAYLKGERIKDDEAPDVDRQFSVSVCLCFNDNLYALLFRNTAPLAPEVHPGHLPRSFLPLIAGAIRYPNQARLRELID
jgi:hypothetical protein